MQLGVFGLNTGSTFRPADTIALAQLAEALGFDSVWAGEHVVVPSPRAAPSPMEPEDPILDPLVHLGFVAAATERVLLATGIIILPQRNPLVLAKQAASLDVLSGGRLLLGIGAGYLEPEFEVLGADFANRNDVTDDAIVKMKQAWTGESIDGHTMRPTPAQAGGPPIWIGGNSKRAARRAVELGAGWSPFPNGNAKIAARTRTTSIMTPEDLQAMVRYCAEHAEAIGRTEPLDVVFMPVSMTMFAGHPDWTPDIVVEEVHALAEAGMTAMTVTFEADSRKELADDLARFGDEVLPRLPS